MLGTDRRIIKKAGFVKDIVSIGYDIVWVSEGSKILNWIDSVDEDRASRALDIGNSFYKSYYLHKVIF